VADVTLLAQTSEDLSALIAESSDPASVVLAQCELGLQALTHVATVVKAKQILAIFTGIEAATRFHKLSVEAEARARTCRIRAKRRMGELLQDAKKNKGGRPAKKGKGGRAVVKPVEHVDQFADVVPTLSDLRISKTLSSDAQRLAAIPTEAFDTAVNRVEQVAVATGRSATVTEAAVLRTVAAVDAAVSDQPVPDDLFPDGDAFRTACDRVNQLVDAAVEAIRRGHYPGPQVPADFATRFAQSLTDGKAAIALVEQELAKATGHETALPQPRPVSSDLHDAERRRDEEAQRRRAHDAQLARNRRDQEQIINAQLTAMRDRAVQRDVTLPVTSTVTEIQFTCVTDPETGVVTARPSSRTVTESGVVTVRLPQIVTDPVPVIVRPRIVTDAWHGSGRGDAMSVTSVIFPTGPTRDPAPGVCAVSWCVALPVSGSAYCKLHRDRPVKNGWERGENYRARLRKEDARAEQHQIRVAPERAQQQLFDEDTEPLSGLARPNDPADLPAWVTEHEQGPLTASESAFADHDENSFVRRAGQMRLSLPRLSGPGRGSR
jgi:hypothetical protein